MGSNRNSGYFLHTIGGTFSRFGLKYGKLGVNGLPTIEGKTRDLQPDNNDVRPPTNEEIEIDKSKV